MMIVSPGADRCCRRCITGRCGGMRRGGARRTKRGKKAKKMVSEQLFFSGDAYTGPVTAQRHRDWTQRVYGIAQPVRRRGGCACQMRRRSKELMGGRRVDGTMMTSTDFICICISYPAQQARRRRAISSSRPSIAIGAHGTRPDGSPPFGNFLVPDGRSISDMPTQQDPARSASRPSARLSAALLYSRGAHQSSIAEHSSRKV